MFTLRPYQQAAVDATLQHFRQSNVPAVIVLPTGAGKSLVIAELARLARRKILVLTHVKELVEQNHQKFHQYAEERAVKSGVYSAGLSRRETDQQVTFASIQSVARNLKQFAAEYSLVIIDECHRVRSFDEDDTNQYSQIVSQLQAINNELKILGLTATPYRLGLGWIYQTHYHGFVRSHEPVPFKKCIYELPLSVLIKQGFLTPPKMVDAAVEQYDFSGLSSNKFGEFDETQVNELLGKYPRVTQGIIEQVVTLAEVDRRGVMIFAATVKHAEEILGYLPSNQAALLTAKTANTEREKLINDFKAQKLKYLVNVSVLTTGFDAPHVDLIAILRPTQSVSLYQQIVGRGLRLSPGKKDCLVIDYAGNDINIFHPEVGSKKPNSKSELVQVFCPACGFANTFWGIKAEDGQIIEHYGRRCQGILEKPENSDEDDVEACDYHFRYKSCPVCNAQNDIAARQCKQCNHALIDPDDKLKEALQLRDRMVIRCSDMAFSVHDNKLLIRYFDEDGLELKEWFDFNNAKQLAIFNQQFGRRFRNSAEPRKFSSLSDVLKESTGFVVPDFVIAKAIKQKRNVKNGQMFWQVQEKIFDYQGNYRKAHEL